MEHNIEQQVGQTQMEDDGDTVFFGSSRKNNHYGSVLEEKDNLVCSNNNITEPILTKFCKILFGISTSIYEIHRKMDLGTSKSSKGSNSENAYKTPSLPLLKLFNSWTEHKKKERMEHLSMNPEEFEQYYREKCKNIKYNVFV